MKVGLIGATGYTGLELLRLLAAHPKAPEVTVITSRQEEGQALTDVFPALGGLANYDELIFEAPGASELAGRAEMFFLAAPHGVAMGLAPALLDGGARLIDLSADFRLTDADVFSSYYGPHQAPELLPQAVYGLPELYAAQIPNAKLIANPGCYPTSIILALAPFLKGGGKAQGPIIANSVSGVSGAGRGASLKTSFCEVQDSFKAYQVVGHRHTPEIAQELSTLAGAQVKLAFTPHLAPLTRGILSTVYLSPQGAVDLDALHTAYLNFYATAPFVRVRPLGFEPRTADVRGTNFCDLSLFYDAENSLLKIVSVIDNLCRGASGQAIANFNLMAGYLQNAGISGGAICP